MTKIDVDAVNAAISAGDLALAPPGSIVRAPLVLLTLVRYETERDRVGIVGDPISNVWAEDASGTRHLLAADAVPGLELLSVPEGLPPFELWPRPVCNRAYRVELLVHGWWFNSTCSDWGDRRWDELTESDRNHALSARFGWVVAR